MHTPFKCSVVLYCSYTRIIWSWMPRSDYRIFVCSNGHYIVESWIQLVWTTMIADYRLLKCFHLISILLYFLPLQSLYNIPKSLGCWCLRHFDTLSLPLVHNWGNTFGLFTSLIVYMQNLWCERTIKNQRWPNFCRGHFEVNHFKCTEIQDLRWWRRFRLALVTTCLTPGQTEKGAAGGADSSSQIQEENAQAKKLLEKGGDPSNLPP